MIVILVIGLIILGIYGLYLLTDFISFCRNNEYEEKEKYKIYDPKIEERVSYFIKKAFVEQDDELFEFYYNEYKENYSYVIEEEIRDEREQVCREYDRRIYMSREQLVELNQKIYYLWKIDKSFKDIWQEKFDDVRKLLKNEG